MTDSLFRKNLVNRGVQWLERWPGTCKDRSGSPVGLPRIPLKVMI